MTKMDGGALKVPRVGITIGVLRLGFPALEKTRGSPPSLRMTSRSRGTVKVNSRSFAALRMTVNTRRKQSQSRKTVRAAPGSGPE